MALWVPASLRLGEMRFETLGADGSQALHTSLVQGWQWSDNVNTAGVECQTVVHGPISDVARIGDVGSTARVIGPMVDIETGAGATGVLWEGLWETLVDERHETHITRYYTGHDVGKGLASTAADYVANNKTLTEVVTEICNEFGLPIGVIPRTVTPLGQIVIRGRTAWDAIAEAVQRHHDLTGDTYRVRSDGSFISMHRQGADANFWTFRVGANVAAIRRERNLTELVNRIFVHGRVRGDNTAAPVIEVVEDLDSIRLYGPKTAREYMGSETSASEVVETARNRLAQRSKPVERLTITSFAMGGIRAGDRVRAIDEGWGFDRLYYVESIQVNVSASEATSLLTLHSDPIDPGLVVET